MAKGDAFTEEDSHMWQAVVERAVLVYVLHKVLYPQVHENGVKKKKTQACLDPADAAGADS
jgi:hypothetical protein